jgi:Domain of unknown function (DUF4451)
MDGTQRWATQDARDKGSSFALTERRLQQQWSTSTNATLDSQIAQAQSGNYTISDPSFTQQLNSIDISPQGERSPIQLWPSAVQNFNLPTSTYPEVYQPTSYPASTGWTSASVLAPSHYSTNANIENYMSSAFPKFEPIGAVEPNLSYSNTSTNRSTGLHGQKPLENSLDFTFDRDYSAFESDGTGSDGHTIINLSQFPTSLDDSTNLQATSLPRRQSSSSFVSSAGPMNDPPDASSYPEPLSYTSDYTPQGSLNMSSTPLSPVHSPRCTPQDMVRASSRTRATPSPRPTMRSNPYGLDATRNKRASTSSYTSSPAKRSSPYAYPAPDNYFSSMPSQSQVNGHPMVNNVLPSSNLNPSLPYASFGIPRFHQPAMPPSTFDPTSRIETVPYMLSNGTFRTLQSNAGPGSHAHDHFCDHADPPDLFGPLSEEQLVPPLEDMKPDDPDLTPHEQELRFDGDLYTPRFVRGHGNKREGWCGICKPGRWLVLKNSAYWYDKSFTHGISAASGQAFEGPRETRRMDGNADVWEGLCGSCGEWIALVSSKKKGTTWFRHAYKV